MYSPPIYLLESGTHSWQFPSPPDTPPPEVEELPSSVRVSSVNVPQTYLWVPSLSSSFVSHTRDAPCPGPLLEAVQALSSTADG